MNINSFLDSTYLKTPADAGISTEEDLNVVKNCIQEAINENFKLIMIRPNHVSLAKKMIDDSDSKVLVGTVIDFPKGNSTIEKKLEEAQIAINESADDLDFVCNYIAFKNGEIDLIKNEILVCTKLGIQYNKTVKWIIETAALTDNEIIQISVLIKNTVVDHFKAENYPSVFVKSSTGFYKTENNLPNGATIAAIKLMLENCNPLPVKASGGIKNKQDAVAMIQLGVKRIGTSNAKNIVDNQLLTNDY